MGIKSVSQYEKPHQFIWLWYKCSQTRDRSVLKVEVTEENQNQDSEIWAQSQPAEINENELTHLTLNFHFLCLFLPFRRRDLKLQTYLLQFLLPGPAAAVGFQSKTETHSFLFSFLTICVIMMFNPKCCSGLDAIYLKCWFCVFFLKKDRTLDFYWFF